MVLDAAQLLLLILLVAERLYAYAPGHETEVKSSISDNTAESVQSQYEPTIEIYKSPSQDTYPTVQR